MVHFLTLKLAVDVCFRRDF